MTIPEMIEMIEKKLAAIEAYEKGFQGVLVGENTVLRLPAGFVGIVREAAKPDGKSMVRVEIVDLPNATMFRSYDAGLVKKDIYDGLGSNPVAMNFRDAIAHETRRLVDMMEFLKRAAEQ